MGRLRPLILTILRTFAAVAVLAAVLGTAAWFVPVLWGAEPGGEETVQTIRLKDGRVFTDLNEAQADVVFRENAGRIASVDGRAVGNAAKSATFWVGVSLHLSMIVVSVVALRRRGERIGGLRGRDVALGAFSGAALGCVAIVYVVFVGRAFGVLPAADTGGAGVETYLPLLVLASISAPLGEELLFRGQLMAVALRSLSPRAAWWLTSVLFAVLHLPRGIEGVVAVPALLAGGLVFGALRLRTASVWPAVVAHGAYNATIVGANWLGWVRQG
jgi:membrane protease YdiL (CAAX protease family)